MSAEIADTSDEMIAFHVTGLRKQPELVAAQRAAGKCIRRHRKARFLVPVEDVTGTKTSGDCGDVSLQIEFDHFIEKVVVVGDRRWEDTTFLYTSEGIRRVPMGSFRPADFAKARAWLAS